MSAQYEQAALQRDRTGSKGPGWFSFAIIGLLVIIISFVVSYFARQSEPGNPLLVEFQKTLLEQSNELSDIDYFLLANQEKNTRYFKILSNHVNQVRHRFGIITDYLHNNNFSFDQQRLSRNVKQYRKKIDSILDTRQQLISYELSLLNMKRVLPKILSQNTEINKLLLTSKASSMHIYFITRQLFLVERIMNNVASLGTNSSDSRIIVTASDRIGRDMALLLRVYSGLLKGDYQMNVTKITNLKVRSEIHKVTKLANSLATDISNVLLHGPEAYQFIDTRNGLQKVSLKLQKSYRSVFFQKSTIAQQE